MKRIQRKVCDNCGKVNPPVTTAGNQRITLCCLVKNGCYSPPEAKKGYGSNGKSTTQWLAFPIEIRWLGFWQWPALISATREAKARKKK